MTDTLFQFVQCLECGSRTEASLFPSACPQCGSQWLDAVYDYGKIPADWPSLLAERPTGMWRYTELLPFSSDISPVTMREGWTPLLHVEQMAQDHGISIWIKDERREPTGSFKDRQASGTVSALKSRGITNLVLASTGNAAAAYAAYCARAGIKLWVFLSSNVPLEKTRELALYGAEIVKIAGTYDQVKQIAADFARRRGFIFDQGAKAIPGKECFKTIAYEIVEQLGWKAPDWYIQAVSGGIGPLGVMKGFKEMFELGLIDRIPKLGVVQVNGCAPMARAFEQGLAQARKVEPETLITVLSTGDPGLSYELLKKAIDENGGTMLSVSDGETFRAMRRMAREEGLSMEPASSVAFAGLEKMLERKCIEPGETVVVNCSGHTFSAEKHTLEDRFALYLSPTQERVGQPLAGLESTLEHLDEQVTSVVIIDDNANDSRLIRRFLHHYKRYRIFEAHNGLDGLDLVLQRRPDLVVLDLTLPDMDGLSVLSKLKDDPRTGHIPVVIVSARSLSREEWDFLRLRTESIWEKGNFSPQELAGHVVKMLNGQTHWETASNQKSDAHLQSEAFGAGRNKRILIFDQDMRDARLFKQLFESRHKFEVIESNHFQDALAVIKKQPPDLILFTLSLRDLENGRPLTEFAALSKGIPMILLLAEGIRENLPGELSSRADSIWEKEILDRNILLDHAETLLLEKS